MFLDSGIRLDELVGLTPNGVYEDKVKVFGKGVKERHAPIGQEAKENLV
ncbi:hypothetical protein ACFLWC_04205 [Chloroflexota bacterium]